MGKKIRQKISSETAALFKGGDNFVFANFTGLKAAVITQMRVHLRSKNIRMRVLKNSATAKALESVDKKAAASLIAGQMAVFYGVNDPVLISKELVALSAKNKALSLLGGYSSGAVLSGKDIVALSKMPTREAMLSITLGTIQMPATNLVSVLSAVIRKSLYAFKEIEKAKPQS